MNEEYYATVRRDGIEYVEIYSRKLLIYVLQERRDVEILSVERSDVYNKRHGSGTKQAL